jgi:hypothetical protein
MKRPGETIWPSSKLGLRPNFPLTRTGTQPFSSLADVWAPLVRPRHHLLPPVKIPCVTSGRSDSGHAINLADSQPNSMLRPRLFNPPHPLSDSPLLPPSEAPPGRRNYSLELDSSAARFRRIRQLQVTPLPNFGTPLLP